MEPRKLLVTYPQKDHKAALQVRACVTWWKRIQKPLKRTGHMAYAIYYKGVNNSNINICPTYNSIKKIFTLYFRIPFGQIIDVISDGRGLSCDPR
jgi:hypothetical protein